MKCASATPMGSGVPPARSGWWHVKSRHALLRSRTGLRQSVVAPRLWSVRLVSSASAKRMAVGQTGIPMRPPLGASCEWGYVEWRAAGASQPSAVSAMVWMMSSLRDYGRCAWSVAHLRSAWLWGRPASPCALRLARRANGVMWSGAPLARVSRLRCWRWCG